MKENGLQSVWLVRRPGEELRTVKTWPLTASTIVKRLLGISQAQRQVRGSSRLMQAGIATPPILRPPEVGRIHSHRVLQLELAYVEGQTLLDLLRNDQVDDSIKRRFAVEAGRLVARLAEASVFCRDLKLTNLIVDPADESRAIWVVDTVDVRTLRNRDDQIARMIQRLWEQPSVYGDHVPRGWRIALLLAALRPINRHERRAVLQRLRAHHAP